MLSLYIIQGVAAGAGAVAGEAVGADAAAAVGEAVAAAAAAAAGEVVDEAEVAVVAGAAWPAKTLTHHPSQHTTLQFR